MMQKLFLCFAVPLDFSIIKREHFNRHYSTMAYYLAFNLCDIPLVILNCLIYVAITIPMTGQPYETKRVLLMLATCITISFGAQVFGLFCGSMKNIKVTESFLIILSCFELMSWVGHFINIYSRKIRIFI